MRPENLKLLFDAYIHCKRDQDECDSPGAGNHRVQWDNPLPFRHYEEENAPLVAQGYIQSTQGYIQSPLIQQHFFPFGQAANLPNNVIQFGRNLLEMAQDFSESEPDKSIIKFKTICMEVEPVEDILSISVMRDQKFSEMITHVSWKTLDKTALSGTHYVESSGEIIFNQGETSKDIKIKILNSTIKEDGLRFTIELNYDGLFLPKPMTVSLKKISSFYPEEMSVLRNLPSLPFNISDVKYVLEDCLTRRTFHSALTHLCSSNNAIDVQLALAFELGSLCLNKLSGDTILSVLQNFFRLDTFDF